MKSHPEALTSVRALNILTVLLIVTCDCRCSPVGQITVSSQNLTGQSMVQLGTSLNNSLVSMLGHAMVSLEKYIDNNVADMESRLTTKLCELSPCTPWSSWTNCTAKVADTYGGQTRTRKCWVGNTSPCANDGEQVVENESRVCEGDYCPAGFNISNNGLCLMTVTALNSREDSEKMCNNKGGHLINTDTKERWDDMVEIGKRMDFEYIWIDGLRSVKGGPWVYSAGVEPTANGLQHWSSGEPTNGVTELCKVAQRSSGQYYWYDRNCSQLYNSVCEHRK